MVLDARLIGLISLLGERIKEKGLEFRVQRLIILGGSILDFSGRHRNRKKYDGVEDEDEKERKDKLNPKPATQNRVFNLINPVNQLTESTYFSMSYQL